MSFLDRVANRALKADHVQLRASSQAATGNLSYVSPAQPAMPSWDGANAVDNTYYVNTYVHSAIRRIAQDISALPFRAGLNPDVPKNFNPTAQLTKFLGPPPLGPNPEMAARNLWIFSITQYLVTGKFGWLLERDSSGRIVGVWPLVSQMLMPIRADKGQYFLGFHYGIPGTSAYQKLDVSDVLYVYRPSASDVKEPESPLKAARRNIAVANAIDEYEHAFYRNNAVPSHLVFTQSFAESEARRAFQEQWQASYGGPRNAGKAMFLEAGYADDYGDGPSVKDQISITQLGTNAEDAQTTSARNSHIQDICVALGVPLSVLGDTTRAKFDNADQEARNYWQETILPLATEIMDQVNLKLAPVLGRELGWWDFSVVAYLNPDKTIKPTDPLSHVMANLITRDEARGMLGLGPWTDVDPSNSPVIVPAGLAGVEATVGVPVTEAKPTPALPSPPALESAPRMALASRHAGHEHLPIPTGHLTDATSHKDRLKAWETMLTQQLQALMEEQKTHVLGRLSGRKGKRSSSADALYDQSYWLSRSENLLGPVFRALDLGDSTPTSEALVEDVAISLSLALTAQRDSEAINGEIEGVFTGRAEKLATSILAPLMPTHVPYEAAASLFTELSTGTLSISAALAAIEGAA